jgi:hypothetical protein
MTTSTPVIVSIEWKRNGGTNQVKDVERIVERHAKPNNAKKEEEGSMTCEMQGVGMQNREENPMSGHNHLKNFERMYKAKRTPAKTTIYGRYWRIPPRLFSLTALVWNRWESERSSVDICWTTRNRRKKSHTMTKRNKTINFFASSDDIFKILCQDVLHVSQFFMERIELVLLLHVTEATAFLFHF